MRIVAQRVSGASVLVEGDTVGEIGAGLCLLIGVSRNDTHREAVRAAEKIAHLRIFSDEAGKMNRSLLDEGGCVLAISQFTLYADCRKGRRPSYTDAAPPALGEELYEAFMRALEDMGIHVERGVFGADMTVRIANEGPVTIVLDTDDIPK